nr:nodulation protein [Melilotus officinalis]
MSMQLPSSSSSSSSDGFKFDVFISFRGPDTRYGFTGNLYKALCNKGIYTFIDDEELQRGDEITPSLLKSIEDSRIAVIVFSKSYASSSFCLDELAHIIHYFKAKGRVVLPVFYDVDPSQVRHQNDGYGEALAKHEDRFQNNKKNMERLLKWRKALKQAADLSGYHFNLGKEYEHNFIEKIVKDVSNKINHIPLHVADYPVGLESRMLEVSLLLDLGSSDEVCIIGIHGAGGMGKTTLARAVYNSIVEQFEGSCFLHDVRENSVKHGLEYLQEQLLSKTINLNFKIHNVSEGIPLIKQRLSQKKILLILDDVDKLEQLRYLVGEPTWLGPGSKVLITTRDRHLLESRGIKRTYEVCGLNIEEALELFRWKVGKNKTIDSNYEDILNRAVTYASGLPLAIEVVGSNFSGMHVSKWNSALDKYKRVPDKDIQKILKVSFDSLDEEDKNVFLDIACCLKGYGLLDVENTLHAHYDYCIKNHLGVLVDKSLIKIDGYDVTLHDLLEDMGKEIVRQESSNKPGERSRLWFHDDIVQVLKENMGTENIEMIYFNCSSMENVIEWNGKSFRKMKNLKTLIIENIHFSKGHKYLPSSLRVLRWKRCTSESLSSSILSKKFNVKVLILDQCEYLTHIPDVSGLPNLEKFSFQNCHNLITIHNSVGYLNKLEILDALGCNKIETFPPLQLPSLKKLNLRWCDSLKSFPELLCKMTNIKQIWLWNTIVEPFSLQYLNELRGLHMHESGMFRFPKHTDKLYSIVFSNVESLNLAKCNLSDECLSILLKWCVNVIYLNLSGNNFKILPECLSECHHIRELDLNYCKSLEEIRGIPPNLKILFAIECYSLSSSSRRMLLSQKLHEGGCTRFRFPNGTEGIPDWFEHKSRGQTISFWFRKEIPSITSILLIPKTHKKIKTYFFVNGYHCSLHPAYYNAYSETTYLFDLKLKERIKCLCPAESCKTFHRKFMCELDEALLKNEWIQVEINLSDDFCYVPSDSSHEDEEITLEFDSYREEWNTLGSYYRKFKYSAEMGIHVWKEKNNTEDNVIFTNPYSDTKSNKYLSTSITQFHQQGRVSEREKLQRQYLAIVSGMQNLLLTDAKEKEHHG